MKMSSQAWLTSAMDDKFVNRTIVLARSLRRVKTTKKLAVITSMTVSKTLRDKLKVIFDLVVLLEQRPTGWGLEDYAKVEGFSLTIFNKCVYLSPNTVVLKNCDDIFEKYNHLAFSGDNKVDSSVYLFTPSMDLYSSLTSFANNTTEKRTMFFNTWLYNYNQSFKSKRLGKRYNVKLSLKGTTKSVETCISIANFVDDHPIDLPEECFSSKLKDAQLGLIEMFALKYVWKVYTEDITQSLRTLTLSNTTHEHDPVAIVGLSFRLPGGNNVDEFWNLLISGKEAIQNVPSFRWRRDQIWINSEHAKNRNLQAGFLNVPIDEFDAKFFGLSPKEAVFLDPQQRLLHEVTWEALEDAGIDPLTLHGTHTGIFVGSWIHDYKDLAARTTDVDFFRVYMGNSIAAEAARLSHFLGTTGLSIGTESGCSSAIVGVDLACKSLRCYESNLAIACGVNLLIHPFDGSTLSYVIAPDGRCKTFDAKANGFGRAEACAALVMKRLSDAVRHGDNIWGLIRGTGVTQEGLSKSLGTPTVQCEALAMELALKDGGVDPAQVSFIEAHGTGTPVGDPMEFAAISKVYTTKARTAPLIIGSVKTNVGHTESASGITGIIKVLLSMKNEMIPPHLNLEAVNPEIDLDIVPAQIPSSPIPWVKQQNKPRLAGVSSFGISGTDGHAIVEEPPQIDQPRINFDMHRPLHIMKISAKSKESFDQLLQLYANLLDEKSKSEGHFADIAFSANTGRSTFNYRAVIVAEDCTQAAKILQQETFNQNYVQSTGVKLCFLFTGQGSQYVNMAITLYETSPIFKLHFDRCDHILQKRYNISIKDVLWRDLSKDDAQLNRTLFSQTSIFCVEYCLLMLWVSWGVKPDYVMGHSLGEFCAAVAAGALSFEDALMLVAERSKLIENLPQGKMLVINADQKTVSEMISSYKSKHPNFWVDFAAINSFDQTVVAGDTEMIEDFAQFCTNKSLKSIILASTHAFHSRHMDPMLTPYRHVSSTIKPPKDVSVKPQYISGMKGKLTKRSEINSEYWVAHTKEKVKFMDACKVAQSEGCTLFLEIGPHPVLSALTMMNMEGLSITCLPSIRRNENEWVTMLDTLSKLYLSEWSGNINWKGFDNCYHRKRLPLPFYPFNRKSIWATLRPIPGQLHPLLGKLIPTAASHTIYEQSLTIKKVDFVQDHVIGNTIIFPGAGFLEMCLSAGHSTVQGFTENFQLPRRPVVLKGLKITSPLALYDSELCVLQTVVSLTNEDGDEELGYSVTVNRMSKTDETGGANWTSHASATFIPFVSSQLKEISKLDVVTMQNTWTLSTEAKEFYEKLPEVGLRFGPKFQSLEKAWKSTEAILLQVKVTEKNDFLIHPIVADAMVQACMLWSGRDKIKQKLQVPVHIGEFIWLANSAHKQRYIYTSSNDKGLTYALLVDPEGTPLAYMGFVDFAETTAKLVEGMIRQQNLAMPMLWQEIYKTCPGRMQNRMEFGNGETNIYTKFPADQKSTVDKYNNICPEEKTFFEDIKNRVAWNFLNALYELGWKPEIKQNFSCESLMEELGIQQRRYKQYVNFFCKYLAEMGIYETQDKDEYKFLHEPPSHDTVRANLGIMDKIMDVSKKSTTTYQCITEIGMNLKRILSGDLDPLQVLFHSDPNKPDAGKFYEELSEWCFDIFKLQFFSCVVPSIHKIMDDWKQAPIPATKPVFRILEVGAGTGVGSRKLMETCEEYDISFEYYYTDISVAFFTAAEKRLERFLKHVTFKKLNIEEDPLHQGFCPEYFDMILAFEVLHVAKNIKKMLMKLRSLLRPNGIIQFIETITPDPRITSYFGLMEGYWQFEDFDIRPDHVTLTPTKWKDSLLSAYFSKFDYFPAYFGVHACIIAVASPDFEQVTKDYKYTWLIFGDGTQNTKNLVTQMSKFGRQVDIINQSEVEFEEENLKKILTNRINGYNDTVFEGVIYLWGLPSNDRDQTRISLPFVTLCQVLSNMTKTPPRVYVVTQGLFEVHGSEVINPTAGTLTGLARSIENENIFTISHIDLSPQISVAHQTNELFYNLWNEKSDVIILRNNKRYLPKLTELKITDEYLPVPNGSDRFKVQLPSSRLIADLEFVHLDSYSLGEDEVEVKVKVVALNFRDVFVVIKPIPEFEKLNSIGLDIAGIITKIGSNVDNLKVGDRVFSVNLSEDLTLPSHVKLPKNFILPLPDKLSFTEGATMPAVFLTSAYCLIHVAKMQPGETILIHTASGGVGLCAIQLCKLKGVNVIATAGSIRKRNFLKNLGIQHVFNSRTTDFKQQILQVTQDQGVDIVLNSITGPGFKEASLKVLAQNGRFIEMSKLSVWTEEEVKQLRPDVFYSIADLTTINGDETRKLNKLLIDNLHQEQLSPIPYERFDALNIRGALHYLQRAKHIGKIVCVMPEIKLEKSRLTPTTPLFNDNSTYLVTGGLGGIGFEVVKWMLHEGAQHIAIVSRSNPKPEVASQIEQLRKNGNNVHTFAIDVGNYEKMAEFFGDVKKCKFGFPPLRGVMHAAGVLDDAIIDNQSWEKFQHTYNPKVTGTWNLHELTKSMLLEHFVLFSSIAATFGSPGQTNHSSSNSFEDSLTLYRHSIGLPGTSVNWGAWAEVGVATEVDFPGVRSISTTQGLLALGTFLRTQMSHVVVLNIDSFGLLSKLFPNLKSYINDKRLLGEAKTHVIINRDDFWAAVDQADDRDGKVEVFKKFLKTTVKNLLKMDQDEVIEDNTEFQTLGVDSLMMLEMKNGMQNIFGSRMTITAAQLKDCNTPEILAHRLVDILEGNGQELESKITMDMLKLLIREDSILPDHIAPAPDMSMKDMNFIETILLTGATGTLGPYLLRELSQRTHIRKIVCIIRESGKLSAQKRLHQYLENCKIQSEIIMSKVECVQGDLAEIRFGLSEEKYEHLAVNTDAVIHSAVKSDHVGKYWKAPETNKLHLRTVNVISTNRILEFASYQTLKHVYHASTLLAVTGLDRDECFSENWQDVGAFDFINQNFGYPVSKHISEQLVKQGIQRGIPCKVFRLPAIAGDSKDGRTDFKKSHHVLQWLACMKLGCMPDLQAPISLMSVDQCAKFSLQLFFDETSPFDVYNISEQSPVLEQQLVVVAKEHFNIDIELVPYQLFEDKLNNEDDKSPLANFKKLYESENLKVMDSPLFVVVKKYLENREKFFRCTKTSKFIPGFQDSLESGDVIMTRDLKYLLRLGIFETFGIKSFQ